MRHPPPQVRRCPICYREKWGTITNSSRENDAAGPSRNDAELWMCLVVKARSAAGKKSIA